MTNPTNYKDFGFEAAGVWISAPSDVNVSFKAAEEAAAMRADPARFQLIRLLGNLKFTNDGGSTTFKFSPPVRLHARYTSDDKRHATGKPLALAWWNGQQWVRFGGPAGQSQPASGGRLQFDIDEIGDPPIGWGRVGESRAESNAGDPMPLDQCNALGSSDPICDRKLAISDRCRLR